MEQYELKDFEIKVSNIDEKKINCSPKIVVVGVGGGGGNMISHFARTFALENNKKYENIKLVSVNTDLQALSTIDDKNITVLQIGKKLTRGLGAGMNPEVGRDSALESYDEIKKVMSRF